MTGSNCGRGGHHCGQRHGVVVLAVHGQGALVQGLGHSGHRKPRRCRADQNQLLQRVPVQQRHRRVAGDEGTKGKAGQGQRPAGRIALGGMRDHRQQVVALAPAFVVRASALPHAAEVEAPGIPTALHKSARQGLHDFVVQRAAEQRVRVSDHCGTAPCTDSGVARHLQQTGWARNGETLGLRVHATALRPRS